MGWMDRLLQKSQTSSAVTGRDLSQSVIDSAIGAGLQYDYGDKFRYAQLEQQAQEFNKTAELKNKEIDSANARTQMMQDVYDRQAKLAENQAMKQNIGSVVAAVPSIDKYLGISDKVKLAGMKYAPDSSASSFGANMVDSGASYVGGTHSGEAFSYGVGSNYGQTGFEAATTAAEYAAPGTAAVDAGMYGTGKAAFNYAAGSFSPAAFGTNASEAASFWAATGETVASSVVSSGEAALAGATASWGTGIAAGSWGVAAGAAEGAAATAAGSVAAEGSLLGAVGTIGASIPVAGWICAAVVAAVVVFSDDSIICTEMYRRHNMSKRDLCITNLYRKRFVDDDTYTGYLILFTSFVNRMRTSDKFYNFVKPITNAFITEIKHRMGRGKGSFLGKLLIDGFSPVCSLIAKANRVKERINGYIVRIGRNWCRNHSGC